MSLPAPPALDATAAEKFRAAGVIAGRARRLGASLIRPGALLREAMEAAEAFIRDHGAMPAFPAQTSRNHCAAHYCPSPADATVYEEGDLAKIDIGVAVDGYVADTAETVYLGDDAAWQRLVQASRDALYAAIEVAGPGVPVSTLSAAIEQAIERQGYRPVYNLTGHGVARWKVHTAPQIPPTPDRRHDSVLREGMVVAIEPFATDGRGTVYEQGRAEVFMLMRKPKKMKGIDEQVWKVIDAMNGLPFARRTFGQLPADAVESTMARLLRTGCLLAFPPLVDPDPAVRISQCEHTILVTGEGVEVLTLTDED